MHHITVDDQLYTKLGLRATAAGYASVDEYICDILREELADREDVLENVDHLFTPERLALIDQAVAELDAGRGIPAELVHEHFRRKLREKSVYKEVDWWKLIACRGPAWGEGVPKAIDLLFDGPLEDRRRAYFGIDNYVVVQGGLYESAPYAARHLVERLKAEPEKLNIEILDILFEIANGRTVPVRDGLVLPDKLVENGPLKGRSIEQLCLDTIREVLPQLERIRPTLDKRAQDTIQDLLEVCAERDQERRCRSPEPGA